MTQHVKESLLFPEQERVALFEATEPGLSPVTWAEQHTTVVAERLATAGACLLRGFDVPDETVFSRFVRVFGEELNEYTYRSTPRNTCSR